MTFNFRRFLSFSLCFLLLSNIAYSEQQGSLFLIDPSIRSSQDALMPIAQSTKEWNIVLDSTLVSADNDAFELVLPDSEFNNQILSVVRTSYRRYASGNTQWVGEIVSSQTKTGYIIINMIDGMPFAVINLNGNSYEIYSDSKVGTRLAKVSITPFQNDVVTTSIIKNKAITKAISDFDEGQSTKSVNGTSVVDVLVVIDDDLNFAGSPIFSKITSDMMNADLILAQSGSGGSGIPLILNFLPIETINIPSNLQNVTCTFTNICTSFNTLANGKSSTSINLINKRNSSNADVIALYIDFDPAEFVVGDTTFDSCGLGGLPLNSSQDNIFSKSFTLHASGCTSAQFVLLHEIMHNFGSNHIAGEPSFTNYAHGIDVVTSGGDISTVMACSAPYVDPSIQTCNRIMQISSPLVTFNGSPIGNASTADNARFLTECNANNSICRRDQLAKRRNGTSPVDLLPTINITTPIDGSVLVPTSNFALTAQASDDVGIVAVNWTVSKNGQVVSSGLGSGANFSFFTNAFVTGGQYAVSASVEDTIGQITIDTNVITVDDSFDVSATIINSETSSKQGPGAIVKIQNLGPSVANNIVFTLSATSFVGGGADISNLPNECIRVNPGNFSYALYQCNVNSLSVNGSFNITWDLICHGDGQTSNALVFDVAISTNDSNSNNNTASFTRWDSICYF